MSFPRFSLSSFVTLFSFQGTIFYIDIFDFQLALWLTFGSAFVSQTLVEMRRIELLTPCLQGRCSPSWATPPNFTLVNFDEVRIFFDVVAYSLYARPRKNSKFAKLVGLSGLEPPTSRLSGVRSNRLSYRPMQGFYWVQFPFPTYINILCFKCSCFHMYIQR